MRPKKEQQIAEIQQTPAATVKGYLAIRLEDVRIRYCILPTSEESLLVTAYAASVGMTPKEFRDSVGAGLQADDRVLDVEATNIQWFKRKYGYIPILNRDDDGGKDQLATDEFLEKHFAVMLDNGL